MRIPRHFLRGCRTLALPLCLTSGGLNAEQVLPVAQEPAAAHFVIRASDIDTATVARLTRMLEAERTRVLADLGMSSATVVTIDMYATWGAMMQAAAARGVVMTPGMPGFAFGVDQVHVVSPRALGWTRLEDTASYLVHEFTHCLMVQRNPRIADSPRWLWEAIPTYEAHYEKNPQRWGWLDTRHPPAFATMIDPQDTRPIDIGFTVGAFIVQRWGTRAFRDLVDRNGRVEDALGLTQARFEEEWFAWVRKAYGI